MTFVALPTLQKNSLSTTTTTDMTTGSLSVEVTEQAVFYRADALLTNGWVLGPDNAVEFRTEEVIVTATDGTSGPGTVTFSTRAVKADGTNGAAYAWPAGTRVRNTLTTAIYDQIKDNFVSLRTPASTTIYVDAAATGVGDGTSFTDAFTTIQAAINSLPAIIDHGITIYIRKGTSAYSENVTVRSILRDGSLTLRGEYYWNGQCVAAGSAAANKFRVTAADASNIAAGDYVLITSGTGGAGAYIYYVSTTVQSVSLVSGTTYEVTLAASLDSGNIGSTEYYTICKTVVSGVWTVMGTSTAVSVNGLASIRNAATYHTISNGATVSFNQMIVINSGGWALYATTGASVSALSSVFGSSTIGVYLESTGSAVFGANSATGEFACILYGASRSITILSSQGTTIDSCILHITASNGIGVRCLYLAFANVFRSSIKITTGITGTTGMYSGYGSGIYAYTVSTNAATAKTPAAASDPSFIL
jgi:hypothetical protein